MTSLSFPDVNVWLALLLADHIDRTLASEWLPLTQIGFLRLLTTAAAMNGNPLTMADAYLISFAVQINAAVVTLDRALENRGVHYLVLR